MALYESLLASPHRTLNGEEADYFFVPVLDSCIITRADDAPHINMQVLCCDNFLSIQYTPLNAAYVSLFLSQLTPLLPLLLCSVVEVV
mgnify:CR=1 FL=1